MNLGELIARARQLSDDNVSPPLNLDALNSDEEFTQWAAEAEAEAADRASLLYDDTSRFCSIALVAGRTSYRMDERILRISSAVLVPAGGGRERPLRLTGVDNMPPGHGPGRVCSVAHMKNTLRAWPAPSAQQLGTIRLGVYRLPLFPLEGPADEPEIPLEHHEGLVDWMLYRAFSPKDNESGDPRRAADALALFEANFGPRETADVKRRRNERRRVTAPYGGL